MWLINPLILLQGERKYDIYDYWTCCRAKDGEIKKMRIVSGVYKLTNKITGDSFVSCSKNIKRSWKRLMRLTGPIQHPDSLLFYDISRYGASSFTLEVIEETDDLKERTLYWVNQLHPSYNSHRTKEQDEQRKELNERIKKEWLKWYKQWADYLGPKDISKLTLYKGKVRTFNALCDKLHHAGLDHPGKEAKKYLL